MSTETRIQQYIDQLFAAAPADSKVIDIKQEILLNTQDRYRDLLAEGKTEEEAYRAAIDTIGDIRELLDSLGLPVKKNAAVVPPAPIPKQKNNRNGRFHRIQNHIDHILWMLMLTLYFILSFATGAWYITWLIFLITPALINIVHAIFDTCRKDKTDPPYYLDPASRNTQSSIRGAVWLLITVIYFIISFVTRAWFITWVIFLLGSALQSGISLIYLLVKSTPPATEENTSGKEN